LIDLLHVDHQNEGKKNKNFIKKSVDEDFMMHCTISSCWLSTFRVLDDRHENIFDVSPPFRTRTNWAFSLSIIVEFTKYEAIHCENSPQKEH
jgi:hypothetical protein